MAKTTVPIELSSTPGIVDNSNATAITIDSNENVGIGTGNPSELLHVYEGTPTDSAVLKLESTTNLGGDPVGELQFFNTAGASSEAGAYIKVNSDSTGRRYYNMEFGTGRNAAADTKMIIDSNGNVGIGTSSPDEKLHVHASDSGASYAAFTNATTGLTTEFLVGVNAAEDALVYNENNSNMIFATNNTERMRIEDGGDIRLTGTGASAGDNLRTINFYNTSSSLNLASITGFRDSGGTNYGGLKFSTTNAGSIQERMRIDTLGNVGIGTTSPAVKLDVSYTSAQARFGSASGNNLLQVNSAQSMGMWAGGESRFYSTGNFKFAVNATVGTSVPSAYTDAMTIDSSGNVGIGTTSPSYKFHVAENTNGFAAQINNTNGGGSSGGLIVGTSGGARALEVNGGYGVGLQVNGTCTITGSLSKGSGSFKIDHPLEAKKDTHHLIHSFIEAPQADNIYRGQVDLVNGTATVNIDTEAGMTEGTFVVLNRDIQCFTSNESDWDAVKGSVSGNILTISCQNTSSTATVSWMVIGERQDQHMYDTEWTDDNGKVIVEPLKDTEE